MEQYIPIGRIKAFVYSPRSVYLQSIYDEFDGRISDTQSRVKGVIKHETIDKGTYSTSKNILTGVSVYSDQYSIMGKIDVYDRAKGYLIERKTKVRKEVSIFDGYVVQLYAQYFCLKEAGEEVKKIFIYSMEDNKKYEIPIPDKKEVERFEQVLDSMRSAYQENLKKNNAISEVYAPLSW
ncbi:MAG: type V CRISPR-associated protein Cas4 [Candidatus Kaiserbacteria bacterium]|nr:type V CRISPR-associated protein Cas4 [Candidatus Kaiserbacteria bacterium]